MASRWDHSPKIDSSNLSSATMNRAINKEIIRKQALEMFTEDFDKKLRRMKEGQILELKFFIDILEEKTLRENKEYYDFRKNVLERDGHKCVECKSKKKLNVHHIIPFRYDPFHQGIDIDNGKTLCQKCHGKAHSKKQ